MMNTQTMKHIYLLFVAIFAIQTAQSQIIDIPDANFKNALVNSICVDTNGDGDLDSDVDQNNDGEIQVNEALNVTNLNLYQRYIVSLTGIEYFSNLTSLSCYNNQITTLNIGSLTNLKKLTCSKISCHPWI